MTVTTEKPVTVHTDGEIFAGFTSDVTRLTIEVLPQALRIVA